MRVGILALQGGVDAHERVLRKLGHQTVRVRSTRDFDGLDGLVLPGGESTVQRKLIEANGLHQPLHCLHESSRPILATCAGLILAASDGLRWINIVVRRNGWGRQVDSFEAIADDGCTKLIFIRAPRVETVGTNVEVVVSYRGEAVAVRQGNIFGATYHPELGDGVDFHKRVFGEVQ